jgi:hypothetical protein
VVGEGAMKLKFEFDEPIMPWHVLGCARLMCDIQHFCLFALFLGGEESVAKEFDFISFRSQKYESMIIADLPLESGRLDLFAVQLSRFSFNSPPEIEVEVEHHPNQQGRIKSIFEAFKKLLGLPAHIEKTEAEASLIRARARAIDVHTLKQAVAVVKEIEKLPTDLREKLLENLASSLQPFSDGRHPRLRNITIDHPEKG